MEAMANRKEDRTVFLSQQDLAEYLGVKRSSVSKATHNDWLAGGVPVAEWAEWNRKGTKVSGYQVPKKVARQIIPKSEHTKFDL